ncbi:MAG TPA: hypothetical protein PLF42_14430 [Anaerolineales bacterium]|nr:hypothetical protein [Anaerolineales bacterium]
MNELEKMIVKEISNLDTMRLIDVIGFIRYLKRGRSNNHNHRWIEEWFEDVLAVIRKRRETQGVTPEELEKHIKPVRGADSPNG